MVTYYCEGTKEQLDELNSVLDYLQNLDKPFVDNHRGNLWLGCIVSKLGGKWEDVECRGEVLSFNYSGEALSMVQDTDWYEQKGFRTFLEQRFPGLKIYSLEIEPMNGWGGTNDKEGIYFPYRYYISAFDDCYYFSSLEELAEKVSDIVGFEVEANFVTLSNVLDNFTEEHQDDEKECYYNLYEIVVVD